MPAAVRDYRANQFIRFHSNHRPLILGEAAPIHIHRENPDAGINVCFRLVINGRGDMGRTPVLAQIDLNLMHELRPLKGHEALSVRLEASVFNLLHSSTVTDRYNLYSHAVDGAISVDDVASIFIKGINAPALMQAQGIRVDPQYGRADSFQTPRYMRFQLSFLF